MGHNTLFLQSEYYAPPGSEHAWLSVNIAAQEALQGPLLCHANFRVDPVRAAGGGGAAAATGALRWRYVQGFRLATWETKTRLYRSGADFPIRPGVKFWWRIVVHPAGYVAYVNGRPLAFSPHPPAGRPLEWDALYVQLPLGGEKGEKATWRVHQAWWGRCGVAEDENRMIREALAETGRPLPAWSRDEVRVSALPPGADAAAVRAALAHYNPVAAVQDSPSSVVLRLADPEAVPHLLREMEGAAFGGPTGARIHVARVLLASETDPPVTGGGGGGAAAAAAAAAAATTAPPAATLAADGLSAPASTHYF